MRVLIVNKYARATGGADVHCLNLAAALEAAGHSVGFISTMSPDNVQLKGAFVPTSVTNATKGSLPLVAQAKVAARAVWNRTAEAAMRAAIIRFKPDLVHAHKLHPQLSVAPLLCAAARHVPIVQTLHDYEFIAADPLDPTGRWLDQTSGDQRSRTLNSATFLVRRVCYVGRVTEWIAVSRYQARLYAREGINANVLPNFIRQTNDASILPAEERAGALFLGRLSREKGILDTLVLARTLPLLPVIVAGDGPLRAEVERAANELPNLTFVGRVGRDLAFDLLRRARMTVLPSRCEEAGPLAAIESMSVGTPVVGYDAGGLSEYVKDAAAGRMTVRRPAALVEACERLRTNNAEWQGFSEAGVRGYRDRHTEEHYLPRLLQIYRHALRDQLNGRDQGGGDNVHRTPKHHG